MDHTRNASREGAEKSILERLDDLLRTAERGTVAVSPFLTPGERAAVQRELRATGRCDRAVFFGGYEGAERERLYCLPEYLEVPAKDALPDEKNDFYAMLAADEQFGIPVLELKGSGFRTLRHKDYLGAILSLGLERDAMGDLLVTDEGSARLFCTPVIADFLEETLSAVGNDTVTVGRLAYDPGFHPERQTEPIADTVASPRLDCIVAALADLSREEAQRRVRTGTVEVDYETVTRTDLLLEPPAMLTLHGVGKFRLLEIGDANRRGRLRMRAEKFV